MRNLVDGCTEMLDKADALLAATVLYDSYKNI